MTGKGKAWLLAGAACVGVWLVQNGSQTITPPIPSAAQAFAAGPGFHTDAAADPMPTSAPVRLRIPEIGVDAPVAPLGLAKDGSLDVPPAENGDTAGWYKHGTTPGAKGTAIVAGHVDNAHGPAVFYSLGTLKKGQRIEVTREDRRTRSSRSTPSRCTTTPTFPTRRSTGRRTGPNCE